MLFKSANFAHLISPMMLDSDNLITSKDSKNEKEKIEFLKRLYKFINDLTDIIEKDAHNQEKRDRIVKSILNDIYE